MKRKLLAAIALGLAITLVGSRFLPLPVDTYQDLAHYAVSVRKSSSCDEKRSFVDEQRANAAYWFVAWNVSAYERYRASGRQLLHYAAGKIKCANDTLRFELESGRAIRAMQLGLRRGEKIDALNGNGDSALHMAVYAQNHRVVAFLLDRGASSKARNADGKTALQVLYDMVDAEIGYDPQRIEPLLRARR